MGYNVLLHRRLDLALGPGHARDLRPHGGDPGRGGLPGLPRLLDQDPLRARRCSSACPDGATGSLTLIGTVSPAGGNFEEPVTQATLATVKTFLGLSSDRAYKRFYPAIDPLISWSRYLDQMRDWFAENSVAELGGGRQGGSTTSCIEGDSVHQMMQVTGEEGITIEDFVTWQKSVLLDMVYLQQDAFDDVDASMPRERQVESFELLKEARRRDYDFDDADDGRDFFTRLTGLYKNLNYSPDDSAEYARYLREIEDLVNFKAGQGRRRRGRSGRLVTGTKRRALAKRWARAGAWLCERTV